MLWGRPAPWTSHKGVDTESNLRSTCIRSGMSRYGAGIHKVAAEWARDRPDSLPLNTNTLELHPELVAAGFTLETPPGRAGDLLIWDYFLPHSNSPNRSTVPRMVQIVTMFPVEAHTTHKTGTYGGEPVSMEAERARRVESWWQ